MEFPIIIILNLALRKKSLVLFSFAMENNRADDTTTGWSSAEKHAEGCQGNVAVVGTSSSRKYGEVTQGRAIIATSGGKNAGRILDIKKDDVITRFDERRILVDDRNFKLILCGLGGGFLQAGLFNPWDRALYLSIKEHRPFLSRSNFTTPFAGVSQTIVQRAVSAGLYFPLEDIYATRLRDSNFGVFKDVESGGGVNDKKGGWVALTAGLLAGMTNGLIMNPLAGKSNLKTLNYTVGISCNVE